MTSRVGETVVGILRGVTRLLRCPMQSANLYNQSHDIRHYQWSSICHRMGRLQCIRRNDLTETDMIKMVQDGLLCKPPTTGSITVIFKSKVRLGWPSALISAISHRKGPPLLQMVQRLTGAVKTLAENHIRNAACEDADIYIF